MALSMEEQRILGEIEQELERAEPVLAACLTMFSRPGRAGLLRVPGTRRHAPRLLTVASLVAVIMLTVVPVVIYALVAMRDAPLGRAAGHPAASSSPHTVQHPVMSPPRQR
jgi:cytochrome c-type biogenesis protein CcmH/NrfG